MIAGVALASLVAAGALSAITVGGVERTYQLYVPDGAAAKAPAGGVLERAPRLSRAGAPPRRLR